MLNILRKQAQSPMIQALVLIIVIVFIFWGFGGNKNNARTAVATVNKVDISYQDYMQAYNRTADNFRQQFGGKIPPALLEQLGIQQQVLSQLIQSELLRQGGEEIGIRVSDLMVQEKIKEMEVFQEDGRFNQQRYEDLLARNRMTPSAFEDSMKSDLRTNRVTNDLASFALVADNEIDRWLAFSEEELKLAYVQFNAADFEDKVEIKEDEVATWFTANKENYRSEPKIRLKYLAFNQSEDLELAQPGEEEIRTLYESRKDSYQQPEQRHARHILLKTAEGDSEAVRTEQKKKAEKVLLLARKEGSDFSALAKEYSEGPTKEKGGDLGFFSNGRMVPTFDKAVFSLQPGDISEVVETQFGYHIIKLEEIRPASTRTFEQVKDNLAVTLKKQKAKTLTFQRVTKAYEGIMRSGSLEKYSEEGGAEIQTSDYFARTALPEGIINDPKFLDIAFSLKQGELSSIVEIGEGYAILFVDDIQKPELPELDAVRDQVVADYSKEKSQELAAKAADELLAASKEQGGLQQAIQAAQENQPEVTVTDFLQRSAQGKDLPPNQLIQESFKMPWKQKLAQTPVQVGTSYYLFEVAERRAGAEKVDIAKRDEAREKLLASARKELVTSWVAALQSRSTISTNESLLK
ncbi:SurA N-terminal domain-containing protein [Desulfobulbus sp. US2]|nr:SurA N-terminal domain-containing protein [Desulfobulbus sp. US4]MCW5204596.1 SurA N-terminal domain-containing protein [Desulfobulbus sp. N2]MCW5207662.1 SurA N-terminal domain-containing protein [Desulfobulbus sp. US2]